MSGPEPLPKTRERVEFDAAEIGVGSVLTPSPAERKKVSYIGAPACFALEQACKHLKDAFCGGEDFGGVYVVGSALERPDWRDVDVRMILADETFQKLFPDAHITNALWEFDHRWTLMTVAISSWLKTLTGLPIDFQIQPMTFANERHKGYRHPVGLRYVSARQNVKMD